MTEGEPMGIRERTVKALYSSDLEWHEYEAAIDRVSAFAHGSKLGRLLWRWKYGLENRRAKAVLDELLIKARRRFGIGKQGKDHPRLMLACQQALVEWYFDKCRVCRGAAELIIDNRLVVCRYCHGAGLQRWSRRDRASALGHDGLEQWERRLDELHIILGAASGGTLAETRCQLTEESA